MAMQLVWVERGLDHVEENGYTCADQSCPCHSSVPTGQVIAAGLIDEKTCHWLEANGAVLVDGGVVQVIILPERAIVERQGSWWAYAVSFYDEDGIEIEPGLVVDLHVDACLTQVVLKKAA